MPRYGRYAKQMNNRLYRKLKEEVNNMMEAVNYCCRLSWGTSRRYMVIELAVSVFLSTLPFVSLYLSKFVLDYLAYSGNNVLYVSKILILHLGINVLSIVLRQILSYVKHVHGKLMQFKVQEELMWKSMTMDLSFFDSPDYLDSMQVVKNNAVGLPNCMWNILACLNYGISVLYSFFLFSEMSMLVAIVVCFFSIPVAIINRRYAKQLFELRISLTSESRQLSYLQSISAYKAYASDIRLFDLSDNFIDRYKKLFNKIVEREKQIIGQSMFAKSVSSAIPQFCVFLVLVMLVNRISEGRMTVGDYSLYSGLLTTLTSSIAQFIGSLVGVYEDKMRALTIKKFKGQGNIVIDCGKNVLTEVNDIEFKDVFFCYPNSDENTLENLSFKIKRNEKVCIVGINGAGKSTIIKLLLRFYDTSSGEILINGKNIKEYTLTSLRKEFSSLFQVYDRYAFSLRENVTISDLERVQEGDEAIFNALLNAGSKEILHKVNNRLDIGLSRLFDSEGIELSGGELQKIALARSIYRRCSVMILDEPSAALDPYAENEMLKNIDENTRGKIVIFTAHRLNTVFIADRILVLENGTVVEEGTHEELLRKQEKYAELYQAQAGKYSIC